MQLWFARDGSVSIRDQLATQLILAIASGELPPGKRLPSTRALAKRYRLHPNTVSAAYRQIENLRWVESVHGSGVYVRALHKEAGEAQLQTLDQVVLAFLRSARLTGLSAKTVCERVDHWLGLRPRQFVFVDPEEELRAIVCEELRQALTWPVVECEAHAAGITRCAAGSVLLTMPSKQDDVRALVPIGSEVVSLQVRQVAGLMAKYVPVRPEVLIVIASGWPGFLKMARTVLTAAGYDPQALVFRDTKAEDWARCLGSRSALVCDVLTATAVPDGIPKLVFPLVSDVSMAGLRTYEKFFGE